MERIIIGIFLIVWGILYIFWGIDSRIPKPTKGYHFVYAQDGYEIKKATLTDFTYNDKTDEVNVLVMEKIVPPEKQNNP